MKFGAKRLLSILGLGFMLIGLGNDQTYEVPANVQVSLVMKATPYCRALPEKLQGGAFVVGILYQEKNRASYLSMESLRDEFKKLNSTTKVELKFLKLGENGRPAADAWTGLSAIFLTPMRSADLPYILGQTAAKDIWSIAVDPADCRRGATMSFELVDSRPKFMINLKSASAENCDFSSQLLKLAHTL